MRAPACASFPPSLAVLGQQACQLFLGASLLPVVIPLTPQRNQQRNALSELPVHVPAAVGTREGAQRSSVVLSQALPDPGRPPRDLGTALTMAPPGSQEPTFLSPTVSLPQCCREGHGVPSGLCPSQKGPLGAPFQIRPLIHLPLPTLMESHGYLQGKPAGASPPTSPSGDLDSSSLHPALPSAQSPHRLPSSQAAACGDSRPRWPGPGHV